MPTLKALYELFVTTTLKSQYLGRFYYQQIYKLFIPPKFYVTSFVKSFLIKLTQLSTNFFSSFLHNELSTFCKKGKGKKE